MNDRELLEYAAKAANIERLDFDSGPIMTYDSNGFTAIWNPLEYDDDAFSLAVKLGISISFYPNGLIQTGYDRNGNRIYEYGSSNPYEATRIAIVRAAAEIGKNMR